MAPAGAGSPVFAFVEEAESPDEVSPIRGKLAEQVIDRGHRHLESKFLVQTPRSE